MKSYFLMLCLALAPMAAKADTGVTQFAVSGPLMVLDGDAFWGANLSAFHGVTEDVDVGGETGFFIHSANGYTAWVIPVMPTFLYHFEIGAPTFKPFVGLGLGVGITHSKVSFLGASSSGTSVNFEGLIHLGARIGESKRFFTDMKLGLLDSNFVFLPTIGWVF